MPPEIANLREKSVTLVHHAAHNDHHHPSGSLAALEHCLRAGADVVEIDVIPLADDSFALLHDHDLSAGTNGTGKASQMSRSQIQNLYYWVDNKTSHEKIGFLEEALELLGAYPHTRRLQLDFKPVAPLSQSSLRKFLALIEPVIDRVQVTSYADWVLRALVQFAPGLALGFDPLLYLDLVEDTPRPKDVPPFRLGAYGLMDDHPLSVYLWGSLGDYFAARASALLVQVPRGCQWFIRAALLKMALDANFDWIEFLHQNGSTVDGWTINVNQAEHMDMARLLVAHGIDALTTDTPAKLAAQLSTETNL